MSLKRDQDLQPRGAGAPARAEARAKETAPKATPGRGAWNYARWAALVAGALLLCLFVLAGFLFRAYNEHRADVAREAVRKAGYPVTGRELQEWYDARARTKAPYVNDALDEWVEARDRYRDDLKALEEEGGERALRQSEASKAKTRSLVVRILESEPGHIRYWDPAHPYRFNEPYSALDRSYPGTAFDAMASDLFERGLSALDAGDTAGVADSTILLLKEARLIRDEPTPVLQRDRWGVLGSGLQLLALAFGADGVELPDATLHELGELLREQEVSNAAFLVCLYRVCELEPHFDPARRPRLPYYHTDGAPYGSQEGMRRMLSEMVRTEGGPAIEVGSRDIYYIEEVLSWPLFFLYDLLGINRVDEAIFLENSLDLLRYLHAEAQGRPQELRLGASEPIPWYCLYARAYSGMLVIPRSRHPGPGRWAAIARKQNDGLLRTVATGRTALAIQRFKQSEGRLPDQLKELVPRYLEGLPQGPEGDGPIRYEMQGEAWRVFFENSADQDEVRSFSGAHRWLDPPPANEEFSVGFDDEEVRVEPRLRGFYRSSAARGLGVAAEHGSDRASPAATMHMPTPPPGE